MPNKDRWTMRLLHFQTDSDPHFLGDARRQVRNAMVRAGVNGDVAADMEIAVGEALSNVYLHAYGENVGPVRIELILTDSILMAVVCDDGCAAAAPPIPRTLPTGPGPGGRGLYLASRLTDQLTIKHNSSGHGLRIEMTKGVGGGNLGPVRTPPSEGVEQNGAY